MGLINFLVIGVFLFLIFFGVFFFKKKAFLLNKKALKLYMILLGVLFLVFISIFDYTFSSRSKQSLSSANIVFLLDVSKSMLVQDYGDYSRLQVAKGFIKSYVKTFPNNRYSLVIFSQDTSAVVPLTSDKSLFFQFLDTTDERSLLKSGTNFPEGLKEAYSRFIDEPNGGAIVLLSDFETNLDKPLEQTLLNGISSLKKTFEKSKVRFVGIGVGDEDGGKIPESADILGNIIYKKDELGNTIISRFSQDFFGKIVSLFSGESVHIRSVMDLEKKYYFDIPSQKIQIELSSHSLLSRYLIGIAYILFLGYIFLFYNFLKNEKKVNYRRF